MSLQILRQNDLGLNRADFAARVNAMHGLPQPLTEYDIADIENPNSPKQYSRVQIEEIALFLTRELSKDHSRLILYTDIPGLAAKVQS